MYSIIIYLLKKYIIIVFKQIDQYCICIPVPFIFLRQSTFPSTAQNIKHLVQVKVKKYDI